MSWFRSTGLSGAARPACRGRGRTVAGRAGRIVFLHPPPSVADDSWLPRTGDRGGMTAPAERPALPPAHAVYELRISGSIPADLVHDLSGINMTVAQAETVLYGTLQDQSALFGLLLRIHDLGLQVLEVRRLAEDDTAPPM